MLPATKHIGISVVILRLVLVRQGMYPRTRAFLLSPIHNSFPEKITERGSLSELVERPPELASLLTKSFCPITRSAACPVCNGVLYFNTRLLPVSATHRLPAESKAKSYGVCSVSAEG